MRGDRASADDRARSARRVPRPRHGRAGARRRLAGLARRARSSASSASRAAASRRSRGRCSACSRRSAATIALDGAAIDGKRDARELRRRVQMIFQDPYQTLNPRQRVGAIVAEPLVVQGVAEGRARGAGPARDGRRRPRARALPGPLPAPALRRPAPAGGDRRRAGARAGRADLRRAGLDARRLGPHPDPRACWSSCSAAAGSALLFITHDLSLAWSLCDRIAVMYLGRIVEQGTRGRRDRAPAAPVHAGAGDGGPGAACRAAAAGASCSPASCPTPTDVPSRLPLPPALPAPLRAVRQGRPAAVPGRRAGSARGLPAA